MPTARLTLAAGALLLLAASAAAARDLTVKDTEGLRRAASRAKPGDRVLLAPGEYEGVSIEKLSGTEARPVVIRGADPERPPVFRGGSVGIHLVDCSHVTLAHLAVRGPRANGINIDDGGTFDTPARGIRVESVTIEDVGPRGNCDGLKLSGLVGFTVRDLRVRGWGGSAVDMVGCRDGVIEASRFEGKEGFSQSNAIQMKGGTRRILVQTSWFLNCGHRTFNIGGSTGLPYFRPAVGDFEATEIVVAGNRISGSQAPIAWVTASGGHVHHNTIHLPGKWVARILEETRDERFRPCAGGVFERNLVVFDARVRTFVNVGPGTDPKSFTFRKNAWFGVEVPSRPSLPVREEDGVHGVDPELEKPGTPEMAIGSRRPELRDVGARAYRPPEDPSALFRGR